MSRRHFKKNVDQTDLFDLASQLYAVKEFREAETELSMVSWLRQVELNLIETKKKDPPKWMQVSIESIFDNAL